MRSALQTAQEAPSSTNACLDCRYFTPFLGGRVYTPAVRKRARSYIINLVPMVLGRNRSRHRS